LPSALSDYVRAPDEAFSWQKVSTEGRVQRFRMTSQVWHGGPWTHDIVVVSPSRAVAKNAAILYITGADPNPLDLDEAHRLADLSGLAVAHLFQIPNQPLLDELYEDDLIAETLVRCLDSGDMTWPLLLPMTKSAIRAMDVLDANGFARYVVTGSSKRGWTSWLTAATGDKRVIGIAPMVFDNLNFFAQLQHQVKDWSEPSEMISPYTSRNLGERIQTPEGQQLAAIIDPYTYRELITIPKMIINGSNDRYWSVDSLSLYWDGLKEPKYASIVPNAGHGLGDMSQALHAVSALARSCVEKLALPNLSWVYDKSSLEIRCEGGFPNVKFWLAESETLDFRNSEWWVRGECGVGRMEGATARFEVASSKRNQAVMAEMIFEAKGFGYSLSAPVRVFRSA